MYRNDAAKAGGLMISRHSPSRLPHPYSCGGSDASHVWRGLSRRPTVSRKIPARVTHTRLYARSAPACINYFLYTEKLLNSRTVGLSPVFSASQASHFKKRGEAKRDAPEARNAEQVYSSVLAWRSYGLTHLFAHGVKTVLLASESTCKK